MMWYKGRMSNVVDLTKGEDGEEVELAAQVSNKIRVTKTKTEMVLVAQWNQPGSYHISPNFGHSIVNLPLHFQKEALNKINQTVDLLVNPTIVQPSFATLPVAMPPPPGPIFFQPPPMMQPPAPPKIFYPPPFQ